MQIELHDGELLRRDRFVVGVDMGSFHVDASLSLCVRLGLNDVWTQTGRMRRKINVLGQQLSKDRHCRASHLLDLHMEISMQAEANHLLAIALLCGSTATMSPYRIDRIQMKPMLSTIDIKMKHLAPIQPSTCMMSMRLMSNNQ